MINSFHIQNFQSWEDSLFEFDPGVNVIIGLTDSGKSAVIRAIKKLFQNRPLGCSFRSRWGGSTILKMVVNDSDVVSRIIRDGSDVYKVNALKLKAFKTEVPDEVQEMLSINEINFQPQNDNFFLIKDSPGDVAKHFNKVARLDKIDLGQQNVDRWIREINSDISHKQVQLKTEQEKLTQFENLQKYEVDVEILEEMDKRLINKQAQHTQLKSLIFSINVTNEKIEKESKILAVEPVLNKILSKTEERKQISEDQVKLRRTIRNINTIIEEIERNEKLVTSSVLIESLIEKYKAREILNSNRDRLKKAIQNAKFISKDLEQAKMDYETLHKTFEKNYPETCPFCGTILTKK